jgi:hypothetical protein
MKNLSKRDQKARQKATPGWDDRIAEYDLRLNYTRNNPTSRVDARRGW